MNSSRDIITLLRNHCLGLAASSFVVVTQICTRETLDRPLKISVAVFSFTIPLLVGYWLSFPAYLGENGKTIPRKNSRGYIMHGVQAVNVAGFVAFFWHFGRLPALLFILAIAIQTWRVLVAPVLSVLRQERKDSSAKR